MSGTEAALAAVLAQCRVEAGQGFELKAHDPRPSLPDGLKTDAARLAADGQQRLSVLQERLYADGRWALLVILQAQDAAGKDGTIKHVMSGVNPQGVTVTSFKPPGPDDLAHDFLWRPVRSLPARGTIGLFNRSHYEEVLVPRVHPEILARQRLPRRLTDDAGFWDGRLDDIAAFERHLGREGTRVIKFFLNVSRDEQKKRFMARLDEPDKLWKFDPTDLGERAHWNEYRAAYQAAIAATATPDAPWFIVPADRKWLMRLLVMQGIIEALEALDLKPAEPAPEVASHLAQFRRQLEDTP